MQHNKIHGHSSCLINESIYIYGGLITDDNDPTDEKESKQCLVYNTITKQWKQVVTSFVATHFHSAVGYNNRYMIVFGGKHKSHGFFNTTSVFDTQTEEWNIVNYEGNTVDVPQARYCHKCVVIGDEMFVFGGFDKDGFDCNDMYAFHLIENKWRRINLHGQVPSERHHFTLDRIPNSSNELILFGGYNSTVRCMNDLYSINVETGICNKIDTSNFVVNGRYGHVSYFDELYRLHIIGGCSIDGTDLYTDTIFTIQQNTLVISDVIEDHFDGFYSSTYLLFPRFCTLDIIYDGSLMLYGGFNSNAVAKPKTTIIDAPDDICNLVLSYLDRVSLCQVAQVSKTLRLAVLSSDNRFWEPIFQKVTSNPYYAKHLDNENNAQSLYKQSIIELSKYSLHRYIGKENLQNMFATISESQLKNLIPAKLKIVVVGAGAVGKVIHLICGTSIVLIEFLQSTLISKLCNPHYDIYEHFPFVFEQASLNHLYHDTSVSINLWDTAVSNTILYHQVSLT
jgi:N-acetylneuraminic acid mutarotase